MKLRAMKILKTLLIFSGGFSTLAQEHIFIINNDPKTRKSAIINRSSLKNISLSDGDSVHVPIVHTLMNTSHLREALNLWKVPISKRFIIKKTIRG